MAHSLLYLSEADLTELLQMRDLVDAMSVAFGDLSSGKAEAPPRSIIEFPLVEGRGLIMPAFDEQHYAIKAVSIAERNVDRGMPYIQALVYLVDTETGRPLAIMDGGCITALRTGAATGLATRLFARENAKTMALFGAGGQAFHQVEAVCTSHTIDRLMIFSRTFAKVEVLADRIRNALKIRTIELNPVGRLHEADIICTATTATEPLFAPEEISPGTHINAIGAYRPDMCEIPSRLVHHARVFVDERASALVEAGDLIRANALDHLTEIGDVVSGRAPGRVNNDDITLFKSVGNAVQDLACAKLAFARASESGMGIKLPFGR